MTKSSKRLLKFRAVLNLKNNDYIIMRFALIVVVLAAGVSTGNFLERTRPPCSCCGPMVRMPRTGIPSLRQLVATLRTLPVERTAGRASVVWWVASTVPR